MNKPQFINQTHIFMEIGQESLRASNGTASIELPLEKLADGRLTDACKAEVTTRLQRFINRRSWQPRAKVYCGIAARGVSLRRLTLPNGNKDEIQRLLPFQIEREFPLSPDQLAWGAQALNGKKGLPDYSNGTQEFLVAAVKKDALDEYAGILANCGATPVFSLAALDRTYVCPQPPGAYAVLAIERNYSELITIDAGVPVTVRVLSWGRIDLANAARSTRPASGNVLTDSAQAASFGDTSPLSTDSAADPLQELAALMNGHSLGRTVYVTGLRDSNNGSDFPSRLTTQLGNGVECRLVELPDDTTDSPAVLGLQRVVESQAGCPPLVLKVKQTRKTSRVPPKEQLKWAGVAAGLLLVAWLIPYAEALVLKPHLAHTLATIKTDQGRLAVIDRELDFLQYLQANEPPYLDTLLVLARSAPPGTRFDSISMNRRGEVSLRGSLQNGQMVSDLRSKLIDSGFFASVAVEEQAPGPGPDRQKVSVRMTAQWKPATSRSSPAAEPAGSSKQSLNIPGPIPGGPPPPNPGPIEGPGASPAPKPALTRAPKN